jgi:hypothetical protein
VSICPECGEIVDDPHTWHPECCYHDSDYIDEDDARDGVGGRLMYHCGQCGSEVRGELEYDHDGGQRLVWVTAE